MPAPPAIACEGLTKVYTSDFWKKPVTALRGLDLKVEPGEIFGFIGPNGAGKTTTIKILVGLHRATSGQARVLGVPVEDPESRSKLGFLPERPYFYQHLTAHELLQFYGDLLDVDARALPDRIAHLLRRVDLHRVADAPLSSFSKGMLQRVGLAQALLAEPEVVILDEPMSGLDPMGRALVRDLILEERDRGRTVFFSSHILHDVETLCSRVAVVIGGSLQGVGTVASMLGEQLRHVEILAVGVESLDLQAEVLRVEHTGAQMRSHLRAAPDDVDAVVAAIVRGGGRVLEVNRMRRTLEDVFVGAVQQARPDGGTGAQEEA